MSSSDRHSQGGSSDLSRGITDRTVETSPLDSTRDRRRAQFVSLAAAIVELEGVEALKMGRLAEVAGCARSLIYRYFGTREDLFFAISEDFYEALDAEVSDEDQYRALFDAADFADVGDAAGIALFDGVWNVVAEKGPAPLILRTATELSREHSAYLLKLRERYETRWLETIVEVGVDEHRAPVLLDLFIANIKTLAIAWRSNAMSREEALGILNRSMTGLLQAFTKGSRQS